MQCSVTGCDREARYKADALCQKHYFRKWRNGTTEKVRKAANPRIEDGRGYQFIHAPGHPLCTKGQIYVAEHRLVLFARIGHSEMACELCGTSLDWKTVDVDHIDENPRNNEPENLRPLCMRCNIWRSMPPAYLRMKGATCLEFDGVKKTPNEWSKDPRVKVSGSTIRRRKEQGMSDEDALFGQKKTHNGKHSPAYFRKLNREQKNVQADQ
jgi:5-methylcytosine-specific restriction endonuclease McrA